MNKKILIGAVVVIAIAAVGGFIALNQQGQQNPMAEQAGEALGQIEGAAGEAAEAIESMGEQIQDAGEQLQEEQAQPQ